MADGIDRLAGYSSSLAIKSPCQFRTTGNIVLSGLAVQANGSWSSPLTQDDENPTRILVLSQTNPVDCGIWNPAAGTWQRAKDMDGARDIVQGSLFHVYQDAVDVFYEVATANPIVIGTTSLSIVPALSGAISDALIRLASTASVSDGDALVGYKRTAVGAVASTLHLRNEKLPLLATDFGVVADDSTNNTAAFALITTYLSTAGVASKAAIELPFGTMQTDSFDIPSDVTVFGHGYGSILKQRANSGGRALIQPLDTTNGNHRVTLRNFCVDGNKSNMPVAAGGYAAHGIGIEGPCENWILDHLKVTNTQGHGTQIRGGGPTATTTCADGVAITNCWYIECGYYDVGAVNGRESLYANQATNLQITNNIMESSGRQTIALEGSTTDSSIATRYTIIAHNILRNAKSGAGIDDEANGGGDHIFLGNLIYGMTGAGIRTVGDTGRKIVANNDIFGVGSRAIDAESEAGFAGASLHISGGIIDTSVTEAIKVVGGMLCKIDGVTIISAGTIAVYVRNQVATEYGTQILNVTVNGSGQEGIVIDRPSVAPQVRGCTVINAGSAAFPSPAFSIRGNTGFIESPTITDNTAVETRGTPYTTYGFVFAHLNKPIISGNSVHGTTATNDVQFAATQCTNVKLGANSWNWARVTGSPGWSSAYNSNSALYALAWDADVAPTLVISSNTIAPTTRRAFVGAGLIKTITAPLAAGGGTITLIPTAAFTTDATANVAIASTAVIGKAMHMTYDSGTTKWYPSY